ncbi:MAG: hypothetical protein ACUVTL_04470 [Thermoproteota archaeon]
MLRDLPYLTFVGLFIVAIGIIMAVLPYVLRLIPSIKLEKIHPLIIWVYRSGDLVIATSPILILITLAIIIWKILFR